LRAIVELSCVGLTELIGKAERRHVFAAFLANRSGYSYVVRSSPARIVKRAGRATPAPQIFLFFASQLRSRLAISAGLKQQ
jgi:hypothetical protein